VNFLPCSRQDIRATLYSSLRASLLREPPPLASLWRPAGRLLASQRRLSTKTVTDLSAQCALLPKPFNNIRGTKFPGTPY
jgi:hypothetical protein